MTNMEVIKLVQHKPSLSKNIKKLYARTKSGNGGLNNNHGITLNNQMSQEQF